MMFYIIQIDLLHVGWNYKSWLPGNRNCTLWQLGAESGQNRLHGGHRCHHPAGGYEAHWWLICMNTGELSAGTLLLVSQLIETYLPKALIITVYERQHWKSRLSVCFTHIDIY
jgi:hypothetical protein